MPSNSQSNFATLSPIHFLHTTVTESLIRLRTLTQLELNTLTQLYPKHINTFQVEVVKTALHNKLDMELLTSEDISVIHKTVLNKTLISVESFNKLHDTLETMDDEKYRTTDFLSCKTCQSKGLDKVRNCPLLGKDTYSESVKYVINNERIVKECPTYARNNLDYVNDMYILLDMLSLNQLPLQGGLMNQTPFVYEVSRALKNVIEKRKVMMSPML